MGNGILSRGRDAPIELGAQDRPGLALEYFNGLSRTCASTEWSAKIHGGGLDCAFVLMSMMGADITTCNHLGASSEVSCMNNLIARCSHLFPSLRETWYAIPLRLMVGYGFMEHGYAKLARGPDDFANILHALGMPDPMLLSWATVLVELLGGLAVIVGAFIPLASIPMTFVLLVAIFTVHLPYGFSSIKLQSVTAAGAHFGQPGYETDLLYLAGLAALVLGGSGPFALDQLVRRPRIRRTETTL
jgi:putative oxidoreductase